MEATTTAIKCPHCLTRNLIRWTPFKPGTKNYVRGVCLRCGFMYSNIFRRLSLSELNKYRKSYGLNELKELDNYRY